MTSLLTKPRTAAAAVSVGAILLTSLFGASAAQAAAPFDGRHVLSSGHADALYLEKNASGDPELVLHSDEFGSHPATEYVVHGKPSVATRTAGANVAGVLGLATGDTYYLLPQSNQSQQLFLGFGYDTADYPAGSINVTHEISNYAGPGGFAAWQNSEDGPVEFLNPAQGKLSFASTANHEHLNWGFTAQGTYTFDVTSSFDDHGVRKQTAPVEYTFHIGEDLPGDVGVPTGPVTMQLGGVAAHYHTGNVASLTTTQDPLGSSDHFHWFTRANATSEWVAVDGAYGPSYGFVVTRELEVKAAIYDQQHALLAETEPAKILIDDHGNTPGVGPELSVALAPTEGALVVSVAPESKRSELSAMTLNDVADRYVAEGEIGGITVTDTRGGNLGWSASGRVRDLVSGEGAVLNGKHLGWTPKVVSRSQGQSVVAGPGVASGFVTGNGIKGWSELGSAAGDSIGTAVLGADIRLEAPTTTPIGTYSGVVLITVI